MTEKLLQYIWQMKLFSQADLQTTDGESLIIRNVGSLNTNAGPDFLNARIELNGTQWAGNIELHLQSSDWIKHQHSGDKQFDNVVLHVVWNHDKKIELPFPTLELKDRVSKILLEKYNSLMHHAGFIACEKIIADVDALVLSQWQTTMVVERLQQRAEGIKAMLVENDNHWEETFWRLLAKSFGQPVNADTFLAIATAIQVTILAKARHQPLQIEAMLMGVAGLLHDKFEDSYAKMLFKEFSFLQAKYGLKPIHLPVKFLRMRPQNFPTIRLSQLAALVCNSHHLFTKLLECSSLFDAEKLFDVAANDYWSYHYRFDVETPFVEKRLGQSMQQSLLINTVIPMMFAYGHIKKLPKFTDKALEWLEALPAEKNKYTRGFQQLKLPNKSAFHSQGWLQLFKNYCVEKRCLECAIGNNLLKRNQSQL